MADTYKVVRYYQDENVRQEVVDTGLSLEEAQAYCTDPETSSRTCTGAAGKRRTKESGPWFCGYRKE